MPMNLILVDDHPLMLAGLERLLRAEPDFDILATCGSVEEGWDAVIKYQPDVVVLDLKLGEGDGLTLLSRLGSNGRGRPAVVVLTAAEDENIWLKAAQLGARGVVLKATAPRVLEDCLRAVHRGETWLHVAGVDLSARLAQRKAAEAELENVLTPRELEVVRIVAMGADNNEIADRLSISLGTVKIHLHHVYDKLRLSGREALMRLLREKNY
jgi:two-component system, NarL family, nitrate/nitrite response regulator NarL